MSLKVIMDIKERDNTIFLLIMRKPILTFVTQTWCYCLLTWCYCLLEWCGFVHQVTTFRLYLKS